MSRWNRWGPPALLAVALQLAGDLSLPWIVANLLAFVALAWGTNVNYDQGWKDGASKIHRTVEDWLRKRTTS